MVREEFPKLRSRLPTLWTRSYYIDSVGRLNESTIKKHLRIKGIHRGSHSTIKTVGFRAYCRKFLFNLMVKMKIIYQIRKRNNS